MSQKPSLRQPPGLRWLVFVAALGVSAGAGYWWGAVRHDNPAGTELLGVVAGRKERKDVAKTPSPTAVELVRAVRKGTLDERQQWANVRGFSEEEVKAAIAELKKPELAMFSSSALPAMLFYRWGELDPVAANAAAKIKFPKGFLSSRQAVITAWIKHGGGVAAWDAVREESVMWAFDESVPNEVAEMLVASLSDLDDATAFREVLRLNDEDNLVADLFCQVRAGKASATPESRAAFLAAVAKHPDPYVLSRARENLFWEWAKTDAQAARAGLMALPIPEDEKDRLRKNIDSVVRKKERAAADTP